MRLTRWAMVVIAALAATLVSTTRAEEPKKLKYPDTKKGTVTLAGLAVSDDAKLIAYGMAEAGSDWNTWKVFDVAAGKTVSDELKWVKFSDASWTKDNKGFYYSRFPEPKAGAAFQDLN